MNILKIILLNLLIFSFSFCSTFEEVSVKLSDSSFKVKEDVINELVSNHKENEKLESMLQNMLDGNLYFQNDSNEILILKNGNYLSLFSNQEIKTTSEPDKIKINNKLRSVIKSALAKINLFSSSEENRLNAAKNILSNLEEDNLSLINEALQKEKSSKVKEVLVESEAKL